MAVAIHSDGKGEDDRPAEEAEAEAEADALAPLASPKGMERVRAMAGMEMQNMSRKCPEKWNYGETMGT